jgi:hypothetical protein
MNASALESALKDPTLQSVSREGRGNGEERERAVSEQKCLYKRKADSAHRTNSALQDQVLQLQSSLVERGADLTRLRALFGEAEAEITKLRLQLAKREQEVCDLKASRDRHGANELSEQLSALRHGLHKQLLNRRELEEGFDTYQAEASSAWEVEVHKLREELDETTIELENALHQLDKAHSRSLRQEQLEEEIELYRESARKATEECSKILSMANEIRTQSVKEGENSLREMNRVQRECDKARVEAAELYKALAEEQKKGRLLDLERLNLSRQLAECQRERDDMVESLRNAEQDKLQQKENRAGELNADEIQMEAEEQLRAREMRRMRETHQVLLADLAAVEKRLNVANEELLVYRRLDVYTSSRSHAISLSSSHSPPKSTPTNKRQDVFNRARALLLMRKNE